MAIWPAQNNQAAYGVMACRNDWIDSHPEAINRLLKSLAQAEEYSINHPAEAKAIVQKRLNHDDAYMATVWPNHRVLSLARPVARHCHGGRRAVDDQEQPHHREDVTRFQGLHLHGRP